MKRVVTLLLLVVATGCMPLPLEQDEEGIKRALCVGVCLLNTTVGEPEDNVTAAKVRSIGMSIGSMPGSNASFGYSDVLITSIPESIENIDIHICERKGELVISGQPCD